MKRNLFFIFSAALLLCISIVLNSCSSGGGDSDDPITLTVNPTSISLTGASTGETGSFSITTNSSWSASCNASWLNLSSKSGGSGTLNITVTTTEANQTGTTRTANITVIAGTETRTITVEQNSPVKPISMVFSDIITLTTSVAFKLTQQGDVSYYYWGYLEASAAGWPDSKILEALQTKTSKKPSDTTTYGQSGLTANTEYYLCSVAYDASGNRGPVQKQLIKTKASVTNRANVTYGTVSYSSSLWKWSTTIGPYASKYYMIALGGTSAYTYHNYSNALIAWIIQDDINNGTISPIVQSGSWTKSRTTSDTYFYSASWAQDANGDWAPEIDEVYGSTSSSAKSFIMKNDADNTPKVDSLSYDEIKKLRVYRIVK